MQSNHAGQAVPSDGFRTEFDSGFNWSLQQPDALRTNDYNVMNEKLFLFLDKLVSEYRAVHLAA
jgi:hypothetical protein